MKKRKKHWRGKKPIRKPWTPVMCGILIHGDWTTADRKKITCGNCLKSMAS